MDPPGGSADTVTASIKGVVLELGLAAATLTLWPLVREPSRIDAERRARAFLFIPIIALALGVGLALVDHALDGFATVTERSIVVLALSLLVSGLLCPLGLAHTTGLIRAGRRPAFTGLTELGPIGALAAIGFVAAELYCLASISAPPTRARAIVLAMLLSRWAIVPVGYGLKPLERWGLGVPYEGGIRFREFAGSSLAAFGLALGLYQIIGLAVLIPIAFAILALRLLFSRRLGGVSGRALAAGAAFCELVTFATLAALPF